jgi:hypothetical protein
MAEPSEDDVANFVSFTGVSREQAVGILKVPPLDSFYSLSSTDFRRW